MKLKKLPLREYIIISAIIIGGIVVDQLTKLLATLYLEPVGTFPIIKDAVHLTYHTNRGAAWGMMADSRWIFMTVSTVAIIAMLIFLYGGLSERRIYTVSVTMIISGGIGNMIDRVLFGAVVDFIDFRIIDFPIFNGADSFVCVGAAILILALIMDIIKEAKADSKKKENND